MCQKIITMQQNGGKFKSDAIVETSLILLSDFYHRYLPTCSSSPIFAAKIRYEYKMQIVLPACVSKVIQQTLRHNNMCGYWTHLCAVVIKYIIS